MFLFRCQIRGERFPGALIGQAEAIGFYTTRWVRAESPENAELAALALLRAESVFDIAQEHMTEQAMVFFDAIEAVDEGSDQVAGSGFLFFPMVDPPRRLLLLASERYSLPILQPVAEAARARGDMVAWLADAAIGAHLPEGAQWIRSRTALKAFDAEATLATVHRIAPQLPGLHVQLFHGLSTDKRDPRRGHFKVRGLFDLYCTHGPMTTQPFEALARTHRHFAVRETGWPKLDPLFAGDRDGADALRARAGGRPVVMLASTFTASLSAARDLLPHVRDWVMRGDRHWLLTLHPKSDPELIAAYRALEGAHATWLESDRLLDMLRASDVLVCDTSSVIEEACLLERPIVTVRTRVPKAFMLDVDDAAKVDAALDIALQRDPARMQAMRDYAQAIHPHRDGHAAQRVLEAIDDLLDSDREGLARRPFNAWRRIKEAAGLRRLLPD